MFDFILSRYGLDEQNCSIRTYGNGLINQTWKIICEGKEWLLQRINHQIFPSPSGILENCSLLSGYFKINHPDYLFVAPLITTDNRNYVIYGDHYYRLFHFVEHSYTCNTVSSPSMAYEASRQFGKFTHLLSPFDPARLQITLPDFHNLTLRYQQFESAVKNGNKLRINRSEENITWLLNQKKIAAIFERIKNSPSFPLRVIHHDAKINNVLFDLGNDKGLCVIDLDTVMSGYYISDVGDMLRTYLSPAGEEDPDFGQIEIREEYFREIVRGYFGEMQSRLSDEEKLYFVYAGKFAIYMQALRFMTDYLNDDIYYSIQYENQNLVRANNQIILLKKFTDKENRLDEIFKSFSSGS